MNRIILIIGLTFSLSAFSQSMKPPASTQKISNASLTCPAGKWCRVLVSISLIPRAAGTFVTDISTFSVSTPSNVSIFPYMANFELVLRSSEVLACTVSGTTSSGTTTSQTYHWRPNITCTIGGSQILKQYASMLFASGTGSAFNNYGDITSDYSFYSMEYFN